MSQDEVGALFTFLRGQVGVEGILEIGNLLTFAGVERLAACLGGVNRFRGSDAVLNFIGLARRGVKSCRSAGRRFVEASMASLASE